MKPLNQSLSTSNIGRITSEIEAIASESYHRGWADAIAAMQAAARGMAKPVPGKKLPMPIKPPAKNREKEAADADPSDIAPGSVIEGLYKHVKANPGLKAAEVIRSYKKASNQKFHDVYGRTALKRLAGKGYLKNEAGLWS